MIRLIELEKAGVKAMKLNQRNAPTAIQKHANAQCEKFSDEYLKRYRNGNLAKKARMDKNQEDRRSGKRTYVKGKGWRTKNR